MVGVKNKAVWVIYDFENLAHEVPFYFVPFNFVNSPLIYDSFIIAGLEE